MKRIYLIDCPGVVPPNGNDSEEDILLRGVVRVENVENPHVYIPAVLKKTKPQHIERTYDVRGFGNATEFLELLARKSGRLLKGGEADVDGVAKMVLNDFLRGKIPWFTPPPLLEAQEEKEKGVEGRKGALGEMGVVRRVGDGAGGSGISNFVAASKEAEGTADNVPEDLLDPVIAEPTAAEIIPENIPNDEADDFNGFEEDDQGSSAVDLDAQSSDSDDTDGNESDVEEGGASLLEPDDLLHDDSDNDSNDDEEEALDGAAIEEVVASVQEQPAEGETSRPLKRKRKGQ